MAKKWEEVLTTAIGINGVHINSALVSAQNRRRIYWTNILTRKSDLFGTIENAIPQPADSGEVISDILEDNVDEKYYLSEAVVSRILSKVVENISPEQTPAVVNPAYRKRRMMWMRLYWPHRAQPTPNTSGSHTKKD